MLSIGIILFCWVHFYPSIDATSTAPASRRGFCVFRKNKIVVASDKKCVIINSRVKEKDHD